MTYPSRAEQGLPQRLIVIGGGMTAQHFLECMIARGGAAEFEISLISEELARPYDRVHLGSTFEPESRDLHFRDDDWYQANNVQLRLKDRVLRIDRERKTVSTESGNELFYDQLVVATGGYAFLPPIDGHDLENVLTYRTLEDAERIARQARRANHIVVAGGGLLGLEVARAVQNLGCEVDIIERAPRLLPRQLDVDGASVLENEIRGLGLGLRLLTQIDRIKEANCGLSAELSDGTTLRTDLVLFAAGIRPRDDLAGDAGLDRDPGGGINVDDALTTSDPSIHAIGECVRHRGRLYGFVAPCYEMAEILVDRLLGTMRRFEGATSSARLKIREIDVASVGESLADGTGVRDLTWVASGRYRRVVIRDGRIVGAIAVGSAPEFARIQEAVASKRRLRMSQERRFIRTGQLWKVGTDRPIEEWPNAAIVCTCTGVKCGTLRSAWADGCQSSLALTDATGAGSVCGSCKPLIAAIAGEAKTSRRRSSGASLGVTAVASLVLLAAGFISEPIPMTSSVIETPQIDFLWRDAWWKQASGYTLLVVILLSLTFSLRRRFPRLQRVSFNKWRVFHAGLGIGTIVLAAVHTGLRLGANLNFALMSTFVGLIALGSLSALVTSLQHRLPSPIGNALRIGWTKAHIAFFWPLPVLVLFHVAAVYLY